MKQPPRLLGAHVSTAGGMEAAVEKARRLGCTCMQIFAANPRGWQGEPVSPAQARAFRDAAPRAGIRQLVIHTIYLVNLASPKPAVGKHSVQALRRDLVSARRLGAQAVVVHTGSDLGQGRGFERLAARLRPLLPLVPEGCRLLLETAAGPSPTLGDFATLGRWCRRLGPRVGVCLDSAHLCAAGYDLASPPGYRRFLSDLQRHVGWRRVGCIHLNDSKFPCGSGRDQHENLGEGRLGAAGLKRLLNEPACRRLPVILETPGFDRQGPDRRNLRRLRAWARMRGQEQ
ncbi:MAG: deoxyribonuclease IV [candidate division FCPU426 bacterium]